MKRIIAIGIIIFFHSLISEARHIVGGDVEYRCLSVNTANNTVEFRVRFTLYRDSQSGGAPFDGDPFNNTPASRFGIYSGSGQNWNFVRLIQNVPATGISEVGFDTSNPCVEIPSGVGVERGIYEFTITLPIINQNYMITYQRCCRNETITNLLNPGDNGAAFSVEITPEAQIQCNNSPSFNNFPPIFICADQDINFDHSATDSEGDELIYSFCAPKTAGGQEGVGGVGDAESCNGVRPNPENCRPPFDNVTFSGPYTPTAPMAGNPLITINPQTGLISGSPTMQGQFVVGVCVQEFRNGILLGETRRDFQFNVVLCTPLVFADIESESNIDFVDFFVKSCGANIVTFNNLSTNIDNIVSYEWAFDIGGDTTFIDTRDATVAFPGLGTYYGHMILNKGTSCADTANIAVDVFPAIDADFSFTYDTCVAGPVSFIDESVTGAAGGITDWSWRDESEIFSIDTDVNHLFSDPGNIPVTLTVTDVNECKDSIEQIINWYPVPPLIVTEPTRFISCEGGEVFFNNLSSPINEEYLITWDFGDGNFSNDISPTHVYEEIGNYTVSVSIVSPNSCEVDRTFIDWITVLEKPLADFTYNPEDPDIFNNEVSFSNLSELAIGYQWNFNDEFISLQENPVYTFVDTGFQDVTLVAFHESGCTDTLTQQIDVKPLVDYFMPNAFSPNGDGENDTFIGRGFVSGVQEFSMRIWNRWGEMVYETNDPLIGWNGTKQNTGIQSPKGVYVYQLSYVSPRGKSINQNGHLTLIR